LSCPADTHVRGDGAAEGVVLTMDVAGTTELATWTLGWGEKVEVLEPNALRREIAGELARAAARYVGR
jgi:predicted DNA-binding transcriptional regulator YafY